MILPAKGLISIKLKKGEWKEAIKWPVFWGTLIGALGGTAVAVFLFEWLKKLLS